jgi:hypothetical protein
VLLINSIRTLIDVVIIDFTSANLVSYVVSSCEVIVLVVAQANEIFYHD